MTTAFAGDRSHESVLNVALARFLYERCGLESVAETLQADGKRPDIICYREGGPVIVETEFEPALTVIADALSRLGMEIRGRRVENVFAVNVPASLRTARQQDLNERIGTARLTWQEWRIDGTSGPRLTGSAVDLGNAVRQVTAPAGDLDEAVDVLDAGAKRAGSHLLRSPGTLIKAAQVFRAEPTDEAANMAALVIINGMVFQDRLASIDASYEPVSAARSQGIFLRTRLLRAWDRILSVDYDPIFRMARDVVETFSDWEASAVLNDCADTAERLLGMGAVGRHDLAGRIFNRLIAERKLLAAFYTSIPASILLAGLALSADRWRGIDWADTDQAGEFRVVDPACGTGTLLMAAYRQIVQNHIAASPDAPDDSALHQALVEKVIMGADVVQAAIHITAATLAAMSPSVRFEEMQLHTLEYGANESNEIDFGSLDWLQMPGTQSFFSATREQVGARRTDGRVRGSFVTRPEADVVISNPPYTRSGNDGGKDKDALANVFALPRGDADALEAMVAHITRLLRGTPANKVAGHASSFTVLADRLVKPGGRIALVLPVTALFGESWRAVRGMLAERYDVEAVVSSHDLETQAMSYDTSIAETLVVARRLREGERATGRGRFINLWHAARRETDALALVDAINAMADSPVLRSDGPPTGGTPLMLGGEPWGEIVDGPVGEDGWTGARWRNALTGQVAEALKNGKLCLPDRQILIAAADVA